MLKITVMAHECKNQEEIKKIFPEVVLMTLEEFEKTLKNNPKDTISFVCTFEDLCLPDEEDFNLAYREAMKEAKVGRLVEYYAQENSLTILREYN